MQKQQSPTRKRKREDNGEEEQDKMTEAKNVNQEAPARPTIGDAKCAEIATMVARRILYNEQKEYHAYITRNVRFIEDSRDFIRACARSMEYALHLVIQKLAVDLLPFSLIDLIMSYHGGGHELFIGMKRAVSLPHDMQINRGDPLMFLFYAHFIDTRDGHVAKLSNTIDNYRTEYLNWCEVFDDMSEQSFLQLLRTILADLDKLLTQAVQMGIAEEVWI